MLVEDASRAASRATECDAHASRRTHVVARLLDHWARDRRATRIKDHRCVTTRLLSIREDFVCRDRMDLASEPGHRASAAQMPAQRPLVSDHDARPPHP
jgi:hypothetical protein